MACTRGGLDKCGLHIGHVVELEDLVLRVRAVLGEATREGSSVARPLEPNVSGQGTRGGVVVVQSYVLTEQGLATLAVEAVAT